MITAHKKGRSTETKTAVAGVLQRATGKVLKQHPGTEINQIDWDAAGFNIN